MDMQMLCVWLGNVNALLDLEGFDLLFCAAYVDHDDQLRIEAVPVGADAFRIAVPLDAYSPKQVAYLLYNAAHRVSARRDIASIKSADRVPLRKTTYAVKRRKPATSGRVPVRWWSSSWVNELRRQ